MDDNLVSFFFLLRLSRPRYTSTTTDSIRFTTQELCSLIKKKSFNKVFVCVIREMLIFALFTSIVSISNEMMFVKSLKRRAETKAFLLNLKSVAKIRNSCRKKLMNLSCLKATICFSFQFFSETCTHMKFSYSSSLAIFIAKSYK